MKKSKLLAAGVIAAIVSLSGAVPALADDNVTDDQTETRQGVCSSGWRWFPLERELVNGWLPVGPMQFNHNGTDSPAKVTFTSTAEATMTATASGSFNVGIDAKIASASAEYGVAFQGSVTAGIGNTIEITVPPRSYGYGEYGIWSSTIRGEEQYWQGIGTVCNITERKKAYLNRAAFRVGWDTSTSPA